MSNEHRNEELHNKALELYTQGRFLDTAECLDTLLMEFPEEHEARTFKAWCLMDAGHYEEAYHTFMENKDLDSNNPRLWYGLSLTLQSMGFDIGALPAIEKAIELAPDVAEFQYERALLLFLMERMDESLVSLDEVISLEEEHQDAWALKGRVLSILGRKDEAIRTFQHAKALSPDDPMIRLSLSTLLKEQGRYDESLTLIDEAIAIAVNPRPFIFHKGELLLDMELYEDAFSTYGEGLSLEIEMDTALKQAMEEAAFQSLESVLYGMGFCLQMMADCEESIYYLDKLLELNPHHYDGWHRKAYGLNVLERNEEAMTAYDMVNKLEPSSLAHTSKGDILMRMGRFEEALESYDLALQIDDDDDYVWGMRGECLEAMRRYEEAEQSYRRELDILNDCPNKWNSLARVQSAQGKVDDAVSSYLEAIAFCDSIKMENRPDPVNEEARSEALIGLNGLQKPSTNEDSKKDGKKSKRAVFVEPPKPVNEMNEDELDQFAERVLEALMGTKDED